MKKEILEAIKDKGILLEKEIFDVLDEIDDTNLAVGFLGHLEKVAGQKIITKSLLNKNYEYVRNIVGGLDGEAKNSVERVFVKLGVSLEIHREKENSEEKSKEKEPRREDYKVFYLSHDNNKKIEVSDFVGHFRSRYQELQRILMQRPQLNNLTSINKIGGSRQSFSIIGIVSDKRKTKNDNLIITLEDLTGRITALVKKGSDVFSAGNELMMDDVVAVKCSGNREMVFVHEIFYPDSFLLEKTRFDNDDCVAFVSDVHVGSNKHLGGEFENFLKWLNSGETLADKIKYIFFVGDNVDGVGIYPGQEKNLVATDLKEQYDLLSGYLKKVPDRITMFMCPGQHDSVRIPEPQPIIDQKYGEALYEIPNLVLVSNPSSVKLLEGDKEFRVLMYHGGSIHTFINEIEELRLAKAHSTPAKAGKHMLKRRHLAPMHGVSPQIIYVPNSERDPLVISEVPNVLCMGEVHRVDIEKYNGTLILTSGCWQSQTDYEEKFGNIPDPCKVPILNLKTHELKILDFSNES